MDMIYLDDLEVKDLLRDQWKRIIKSIELAFLNEDELMIPKVYINAGDDVGDYRAMPAVLGEYAALKWIGVFPNNRKHNLPTTIGTLLLNDRYTGKQLMAMDCTALTAYRTAATSAIAAKYCAPNEVKKIALIGCGDQAYYHALAYREVFPNLKTFALYDKDIDACLDLSQALKLNENIKNFEFSENIKDTLKDADIVTTLTPSTRAYLDIFDLEHSCHVNAVGADAKGKRELKSNVIDGSADVICDDIAQATHSGELQYNDWPNLGVYDLGYVIRNHETMQLDKGVSVFDSTGVAVEDIAIAALIYELFHAS